MIRILPLLSLSLLLAACTTQADDRFPSLSKRPIENSASNSVAAAPREVASSLTPELQSKISGYAARVRSAESDFRKQYPATASRAAASSGAAQSSEAWVSAHVQLSRLDRTRADGAAALAELDELIVRQLDNEEQGQGPIYAPLLRKEQEALAAIIARQASDIERLARQIGL